MRWGLPLGVLRLALLPLDDTDLFEILLATYKLGDASSEQRHTAEYIECGTACEAEGGDQASDGRSCHSSEASEPCTPSDPGCPGVGLPHDISGDCGGVRPLEHPRRVLGRRHRIRGLPAARTSGPSVSGQPGRGESDSLAKYATRMAATSAGHAAGWSDYASRRRSSMRVAPSRRSRALRPKTLDSSTAMSSSLGTSSTSGAGVPSCGPGAGALDAWPAGTA